MFNLILICLRRMGFQAGDSHERACLGKMWGESVWEAGVHPLIKTSMPTSKRDNGCRRMLAPYKYKVYITSVIWVIPQWFSCVSHRLGSRPWECLSRIPWWCPCDCMRWAAGLLAADKGRLDIWKPWPLAHKATRTKTQIYTLKN